MSLALIHLLDRDSIKPNVPSCRGNQLSRYPIVKRCCAKHCWFRLRAIWPDCQRDKGVSTNFVMTDFVHEGRLSNGDAHRVARGSLFDVVGRHLWLLDLSDGVCNSYNINE
ncbi:hypothetical protein EJB05_26571, partial [Eragrostis curvula]